MKTNLEMISNEILLNILSYFSWNEVLYSFWSLNEHFNSLVCSLFLTSKTGIILNRPGISYQTFSSTLFPLIFNSPQLSSSIKCIHMDGLNSLFYNIIDEYVLSSTNHGKCMKLSNLKSLNITQCFLSRTLIETLAFLVENQLEELRLSFDDEVFQNERSWYLKPNENDESLNGILQQFLFQIFSHRSQLISLDLDISNTSYCVHKCLQQYSNSISNTNFHQSTLCCTTLRYLRMYIAFEFFLEDLISFVPNLEELSISFRYSLCRSIPSGSFDQLEKISNRNWFSKIPKLKCFTLKARMYNDSEFHYLKWILNNVNHVIKLELHLSITSSVQPDRSISQSVVDADFIFKYCLPDEMVNLKYFDFYICKKCEKSPTDLQKAVKSFKIHEFFINHQWTNVHCFYDETFSYEYISSYNLNNFQHCIGLSNHSYIMDWPDIQNLFIDIDPSIYSFLGRLNADFPRVSSITFRINDYLKVLNRLKSLPASLNMDVCNLNNIRLRYVTKIQFGFSFSRRKNGCKNPTIADEICAKIFAKIISMPVQLKYLHVERFEWLLYIFQYATEDLRPNALTSVLHAEFCISSCNSGSNESIHTGKHLVPLLTTHMPNLRTLCLWRPDDFPWRSLRPNLEKEYFYWSALIQWMKVLKTSQSIDDNVKIFEQDLHELIDKLKQLTFLDIRGKVSDKKVECYRMMAQNHFSQYQNQIEKSRFRLWI